MSGGLWLITSGAYISQELAAEFGQMPPSFLPVGTRRLYEYQIERIGAQRDVYLTLPETYLTPPEDERRVEELGVTVLKVPEGISLGESVVFALNLIGGSDQPLRILHGDTLFGGIASDELDLIGVAVGSEGYSWAEVELSDNIITSITTVAAGISSESAKIVACGYFSFKHSVALVRSITRARGNFISGIKDYIEEHPVRALPITSWYDFGHVQTFFRSRRVVASARHFNSLRIDGRTARKASNDRAKISAEVAWFASVPPPLRIYCARLIDSGDEPDGRAFYETEYGYLPTLAELFVFGTLSRPAWVNILRSCEEFLSACTKARTDAPGDTAIFELAVAKTEARLCRFADQAGFDIAAPLHYDGRPLRSLAQIARDAAGHIDLKSGRTAHVMHGDFCFSNILYDSRVQRIHVIDPRGYVEANRASIYGDLRYDLAKLSHSIVGRYDQIIAGRYRLNAPDSRHFSIEFEQAPHHAWLEHDLDHLQIDGISGGGTDVRAVAVCLFLSMLPLHSDRPDRQRAFIANALRLYLGLGAEVA